MKLPVSCLALLSLASSAAALSIELDFTYDTTGFFGVGSAARNALTAAANDISAAVLPSLSAVTTDIYSRTVGTTTATFDWKLTFQNPSAPGQQIDVETFNVPADKFTLYVGARPLQGSTLGQGGPNGVGLAVGGNGSAGNWVAAVDQAEAASNAAMTRGGPIVGRISGSLALGATTAQYDLDYGVLLGNLWFDNDTDNNGSANSAADLNAFWHFDHTQAVAAGKRDLYSVALHEILHALGIGASLSWDQKVSGSNWLGSNVIALKGSGNGLISPDGDHITSSTQGNRLIDGLLQEVVMDPELLTGSRKFLTDVDLAFLRDIGYQTIPEPASALMLAAGSAMLGMARLRRRR